MTLKFAGQTKGFTSGVTVNTLAEQSCFLREVLQKSRVRSRVYSQKDDAEEQNAACVRLRVIAFLCCDVIGACAQI